MKNTYYTLITKIEKIHRMFLETLKREIENLNLKDISSVQASIVYNIGEEQVNINTLMSREYYLGSNVNYNLRQLLDHNYILEQRGCYDRRHTIVFLSAKGIALYKNLTDVFDEHEKMLAKMDMNEPQLKSILSNMKQIEEFFIQVPNNKKFV
jgi:DNA-binding MarR family transcriptional regulator